MVTFGESNTVHHTSMEDLNEFWEKKQLDFNFREEKLKKESLNPIQAGVFWNHIGWGAHCAPLCFSFFVVQSPPNVAW